MPLDFHRRVRKLFDEALDRPDAERLPLLEAACAGDVEAFEAVVRLLEAHASASAQSFLEKQPLDLQRIDRYVITGELGRGAMGIVYEAIDPRFSRKVAVKVIHPHWLASPAEAKLMGERLFREALAAGALSHPGIVTVYDVGQEDSLAFIVMERVEGPSLEKILGSDSKPDRLQTFDILLQAALALDYAHQNGVVHRDVKPANIMLHQGATVKLTDFGIAKVTSTHSSIRSGLAMGTPSYMSPEQVETRTVDGRSDQFSLAVVAYEMLAGSRPFQADSVAALAHTIAYGPRPSARKANPGLAEAVDEVFRRGLGKLPEGRYSSCTGFVTALKGALSDSTEPVSQGAVPSSAAPPNAPLSQAARYWPRILVLYGIALVLGLGFYSALRFQQLQQRFFARSSGQVQVPPLAVAPNGPSDPHWQRQTIQGTLALNYGQAVQIDGRTNWVYLWRDIYWIGQGEEGWLCGTDSYDSDRYIGKGVLLHTTDRGASWTPIDRKKFNSGQGTFHWFQDRDKLWSWHEVGAILALNVPQRLEGHEVWLAATTGIYRSTDDGRTWQRSTPRPDDPKHGEGYAHFKSFFLIADPEEIYAVGWQGISHWSTRDRAWTLQLPTYRYHINAVFAYPNSPASDVWAVGENEEDRSYGWIYHLKQPSGVWKTLQATGIQLEERNGGLRDIQLIDPKTGFAVGPGGAIIKGSKSIDGTWSWVSLKSPTDKNLSSIAYDIYQHTLWIVGDNGTVLSSKDRGQTWNVAYLGNEYGRSRPDLSRVRVFAEPWIVGDGVVYKYVK